MVKLTLESPDEVRRSKKDDTVHLYYRERRQLLLRGGQAPERRRVCGDDVHDEQDQDW